MGDCFAQYVIKILALLLRLLSLFQIFRIRRSLLSNQGVLLDIFLKIVKNQTSYEKVFFREVKLKAKFVRQNFFKKFGLSLHELVFRKNFLFISTIPSLDLFTSCVPINFTLRIYYQVRKTLNRLNFGLKFVGLTRGVVGVFKFIIAIIFYIYQIELSYFATNWTRFITQYPKLLAISKHFHGCFFLSVFQLFQLILFFSFVLLTTFIFPYILPTIFLIKLLLHLLLLLLPHYYLNYHYYFNLINHQFTQYLFLHHYHYYFQPYHHFFQTLNSTIQHILFPQISF